MVRCRFCGRLTKSHFCTYYKTTISYKDIDKNIPCTGYYPKRKENKLVDVILDLDIEV